MTNNLNYKTEKTPSYCWWLHIGKKIHGTVLYCGDIEIESLIFLSHLATNVHLFSSSSDSSSIYNATNIDKINLSKNYDAIIINNSLDDDFIHELTINHLKANGNLCIYEENRSQLTRLIHAPLALIKNLFRNTRRRELKKLLNTNSINQYLAASSDNVPLEAYPAGVYFTNKNTFLLKEKIKFFILNSQFARFFLNSVIWSGQKNAQNKPADLLSEITSTIQNDYNLEWESQNIRVLKIYYKIGKLIFSFTSRKENTPEYILILVLDQETLKQRINEKETLNYLRKSAPLEKFLVKGYQQGQINGFTFFIMEEYRGVTIDEDNKNMPMMMNTAANLLSLLSINTIKLPKNQTLEPLYQNYLNLLMLRFPQFKNKINSLTNSINSKVFLSIPLVCTHGDYKLENIVLDQYNNVKGFIDWELSEISGFPLLDLFYLIVYNHQTIEKITFDVAFHQLKTKTLFDYENRILDEHIKFFNLSTAEYNSLLAIFFIHNYAKRFTFQEGNLVERAIFEAGIKIAEDALSNNN